MSLTLCLTTPEGIVMAADSRQTYVGPAGHRVGSDSAKKVFKVTDKIGIMVAGPAFLADPKNPNGPSLSIGALIQDFINEELSQKETVHSVTQKLKKYLEDIYKPQEQLPKIEQELKKRLTVMGANIVKIEKIDNDQGYIAHFTDQSGKNGQAVGIVPRIVVMVAGYDEQSTGRPGINAYFAYIPGGIEHKRIAGDRNQYGAMWGGQTDVVQRVVMGFDNRLFDLNLIEAAVSKIGEEKVKESLSGMEYIINWGAMTLFDAISFSKLMIETTTAIQRFSDGVKMRPGDIPGVGGPIDIAIILPKEGFRWNQKKDLQLSE